MPETWGLWDKHNKRFVRVFDGLELWTGTEQQAWRITNDTSRMGEAVPIRLDNLPRPGETVRWVTRDSDAGDWLRTWTVDPSPQSTEWGIRFESEQKASDSLDEIEGHWLLGIGITPPEPGKKIKVRIVVEECE